MAKNWRSYPPNVRAALVALSQGTCYWPGCTEPVLKFVGEEPELNVEIAHIRAANDNGPRFIWGMTLAERNAFGNLILLCVPHHKRVDKDETTYSIGTLDEWKQSREAPGHGALDSIGLSRDELEDAITESIESVKEQIGAALARFERVDAEAAALIRALMQQLTEQRRYVVDPDTAAILLRASRDLVHLQDTASILMKASGNLQGLQDSAAALSRAADKIARSRDR